MSASKKHLIAVGVAAAVTTMALAACSDLATNSSQVNSLAFAQAFASVPAGFSANSNSFPASADLGMPFFPGPMAADKSGPGPGGMPPHDKGPGDHHDGFGPEGVWGMLMGGGLGPDFIGAIAFGKGGRGPFYLSKLPSICTYASATGRFTCPEKTERGLKIKISFAFKDTAGVAQSAYDTLTTNSVNQQTTVTGTLTRKDSSVTTLDHSSDRTVTGLAAGSTQRTVSGTAAAHESSSGKRDSVSFTLVRDAADTTHNVVVPIVDGKPTIPTSGSVIRRMTVTITPHGGTAVTKSRREEITFDGTNVIKIKVTQDGTTKNCTITLPDRKLVCE